MSTVLGSEADTDGAHAPANSVRQQALHSLRTRSTTRRVQVLAGTAIVALIALCVTSVVALTQARDGIQVMGYTTGPQVVETANLYYALSDMDAQVANVLVIGDEHELGDGREAALETYEQRREEANEALVEVAQLTEDDPSEQQTVEELLDGLAAYDELRAEAILLSEQADHPPGDLPEGVREVYDEAADIMRVELLPNAYDLTLERGSLVQTTYAEKYAWVIGGAIAAAVVGLVAVLALIRLQVYLRRRFRRSVSPVLVVATLGTVAFMAGITAFLLVEARHLQTAKEDGFDSVLALASARADATVNHADQSRYLIAPEEATQYEEMFLENSQSILDVSTGTGNENQGPDDLDEYRELVADSVLDAEEGTLDQPLGGLLGEEFEDSELEGHDTAILTVLQNYNGFQVSDETTRAMAERGNTRGAIQFLVSSSGGEGTYAFNQFDTAISELTELHQETFDDAIAAGERGLTTVTVAVPALTILLAGFVIAAARPRLAEYR